MDRQLRFFTFFPSIFSAGWSLSIYYAGLQFERIGFFSQIIGLIVLFICIFLAIRHTKVFYNEGFLTLKQALKAGIKVAFVTSVLLAIFNFFFLKYINLEYAATHIEATAKAMKQDNLSEKVIAEKLEELRSSVLSPWGISTFVLGSTLIAGAFMSFISSTFLIKNPT